MIQVPATNTPNSGVYLVLYQVPGTGTWYGAKPADMPIVFKAIQKLYLQSTIYTKHPDWNADLTVRYKSVREVSVMSFREKPTMTKRPSHFQFELVFCQFL
jgi:hypothetical protein